MELKIVFSRTNTPVSKLIRFFDKGKWSHVSIILDENHIIDSRFLNGVQIRHFDYVEYEIMEIDGDPDKIIKYIGSKYDLAKFIWYGFRFGKKIWDNPNELICSELIAEANGDYNLYHMPPNEQYEYIKKNKLNKKG